MCVHLDPALSLKRTLLECVGQAASSLRPPVQSLGNPRPAPALAPPNILSCPILPLVQVKGPVPWVSGLPRHPLSIKHCRAEPGSLLQTVHDQGGRGLMSRSGDRALVSRSHSPEKKALVWTLHSALQLARCFRARVLPLTTPAESKFKIS